MRIVILATRNRGKVAEIKDILKDLPFEFKFLLDYPSLPEIVEDGSTLEENALKKAREVFRHTNIPSISDDSGLEVFALNNRPGVYSARYAGENVSYEENNEKLLRELENIPQESRTARFRCVSAFVGEKFEYKVEGICNGKITFRSRGTRGFGYDPLFFCPEFSKTFGEISPEEKNSISHRNRAMIQLREKLKNTEY